MQSILSFSWFKRNVHKHNLDSTAKSEIYEFYCVIIVKLYDSTVTCLQ